MPKQEYNYQHHTTVDGWLKAKDKRIKELETALKVIHTWASCDDSSRKPRYHAMGDIADMCKKGLYGKEES